MKRLLAFFLLPLAGFALTRISDTVYTATGERAKAGSYLVVTWPRFTTDSSHAVFPNTLTVPMISGAFTLTLEPTTNATFPFRYTVEYHLTSDAGALPVYTESWIVPDTATTQSISNVVVTTTPVVNGAPPLMKGDLSTSDGVNAVRLPAPPAAGLVLQTDPTQPTGLKYGPTPGSFDSAGAAATAESDAIATAQVNTATAISALNLNSASQHAASDFDLNGAGAAAQAIAKAYTDSAVAAISLLPGPAGVSGQNGESAYQLSQDQGYSGTLSEWLVSLQGPAGPAGTPGATGAAGTAATISVGPVTALAAGSTPTVQNSGTSNAAILKFGIPAGATGPAGPTGATGATGPTGAAGAAGTGATISIASVSGLAAGATPTVTNSGTPNAVSLRFGIPVGATGATGASGPAGPTGAAGSTGSAATVTVGTVTALAAGATPTVTNAGTTSAATLNFGIPVGATGATGAAGAAGTTGATGPAGANGAAATVAVGTVTALAAGATPTVTNTGTSNAATLNFGIPTGATGATGPAGPAGATGATGAAGPAGSNGTNGTAATVGIGTVSSLAAGSTPTVTNAGTSSAAVFNFGIPAGATGSTLYGSYASIPSTCSAGTVYIITSGLFDQAICTATNTWSYYYGHRAITPAAKLTLTTAGANSTVSTTNVNGYELLAAPPSGSGNLTMRYFTAPSATPYTATFAVKMPAFIDTANYRELFVGWFDPAVGYQGLNCGTGSGTFSGTAGCRISSFSTAGGYSATQTSATSIAAGFSAIQYVRLTDDGTTLSIYVCSDYDNCQQVGSVTGATFFTGGMPTRLAWGLQNSATYGATNFSLIGIM